MGTIGRQVRGAWHAGTGTVRDEAASYRDKARDVNDRLNRRPRGESDNNSGDSPTADAGTRRLPSIEWFKPRSARNAGTQASRAVHSTADGAASSQSPARAAAAKTAGAAVKAAVPEAAAGAAVATKAANVVSHVRADRKDDPRPAEGAQEHARHSDSSTATPRRRQDSDTGAAAAAARKPAQTATMASRSPQPTAAAGADPDRPPARTERPPEGTISNDKPHRDDNTHSPGVSPKRSPTEIGP
jgi:hypothetical protein